MFFNITTMYDIITSNSVLHYFIMLITDFQLVSRVQRIDADRERSTGVIIKVPGRYRANSLLREAYAINVNPRQVRQTARRDTLLRVS